MPAQNSQYLEAKVLTAPPHRLHLMLVEAAVRNARKAEAAFQAGDISSASAPLLRAIEIVGEMLATVRQQKSELNTKLEDFYWFLFRRLSEANINFDAGQFGEAITLLEYERETWQMFCEKAASSQTDAPPPSKKIQSMAPSSRVKPTTPAKSVGGFSFEA